MTYGGKSYQAWLLGGAAAVAMMHGGAAAAQDARFDIAPQPLASALNEFSLQSRQSVLFTTDLANAKSSPGVSGEVEVADALSSILAGTGLTWKRQGETFLVMKVDQDPQSGSAAAGGAEVEALIVTAQKREEDIQDVPIAISAFSQEDLTRSQIAGGPDLITQVPNMTFTKTNFSSYSVQLRGIGTQAISATTDPAVAVAFNNTPFIRNRFFEQEFYDLQRVEVLRGPQGTLYGRNATAGVVNIISQKPKFSFEAKLSGDVSNFSSSRLEGMLNIPLVEDKVALRVAGAWTKRDGYATNEITGAPIDGRDLWSTRLSLRFSPTDRLDANLIWEHFEEDDDRLRSGKQLCDKHVITELNGMPVDFYAGVPDRGQGSVISNVQSIFSQGCERNSLYSPESFQTPNGLSLPYYLPLSALPRGLPVVFTGGQFGTPVRDPYLSTVQSRDLRVIESTVDPDYRAKADLAELQISFDLTDTLTLQSETAYSVDVVFSKQDFNRFNTAPGAWRTTGGGAPELVERGILSPDGYYCDPQLGCANRLVAVDVSTAEARQFSQELRLSSDFEGPFNFSLGANFLRADSNDKYYVFINSLSMLAAIYSDTTDYDPYETNNLNCLVNGPTPSDPDGVYDVAGCVYIDANPIGALDDQGHSYFLSNNPYKLISYAVFGEAYYNVTDALKVTAGLRWTVDKKEAPRIPSWLLARDSYGYPVAEVIEQEWREPTGRLTVDWKPDLAFTDETMVYASYAHGYKAGGANPPGFVRTFFGSGVTAEGFANIAAQDSATRPKTFDPEFVDAFELGSKNTLLDGTLTLNMAAFYYDYKNYQISEIVDRSAFNRNFDATVWGLELESDWRPLKNLKLGLKVGYEETAIADGEQAVDLMDRTAGRPGWSVIRPFPTYASNCILPTVLYVPPFGAGSVAGSDEPYPLWGLGSPNGGGPGGCEYAYIAGVDPGTEAPFGEPPNPSGSASGAWRPDPVTGLPTYPGFDPATAPNNGEGFFKQLGGNELPNAPNLTATITGDYTIPLPSDWLVNLHTDLHWQAESDWRIFQDHEFSKLDEYFTMNLAAIFTNEELGWNIMAYIKNVTDETAITGAFLNSDDTGLTTNVFLTEPRLYGLRVTKMWNGSPWFDGFAARRQGPFPFTVELGGQVQRHDAPYETLRAGFEEGFPDDLDLFEGAQNRDLDWGDGREVKLIWRPSGGPWLVSAGVRYGRTNSDTARPSARVDEGQVCGLPASSPARDAVCTPGSPYYDKYDAVQSTTTWSAAHVWNHEEHDLVDFAIGRDLGIGGLARSTVSAGIRFGQFESETKAYVGGIPDRYLKDGWLLGALGNVEKYRSLYHRYEADLRSQREFEGAGPVLSWDAALALLGGDDTGRLQLDWSVSGGALFGEQQTTVEGSGEAREFRLVSPLAGNPPILIEHNELPTLGIAPRSEDVTVPVAGASLGLSYAIDRVNIGAGYRWERYFDVLDGGFKKQNDVDRTIDGPYFKIAVGFGG